MAVDPHKNFAYTTLNGAVLAGDGTITVTDGSVFTQVTTASGITFNATIWPASAQPTSSNAEIVKITNISTNVLTVTRGQEGTTAKGFNSGDQIAATITAHTLTAAETYDINVADYGAKGDGSTDDKTAIQNAINAAGAAGVSGRGVDVFFPAGVYAISGFITCNFNNVQLVGAGWQSTVIYCTITTGDVIEFGDGTAVYAGCGLRHMSVWKSAQGTTGFNINIRRMNDVVITDFVVNQAFSGINILGAGSGTSPPTSVKTWIQRGEINACAATGVGITVNNANPAAAGDTYLDNLVFSQGGTTTGTAGINIINTGHCSIMRCNVTNYGTGLLVNPGDTQSVNYLFIDHCLFDSCDRGAEFSSTGATPGTIKSTACVNSWFSGSAATNGIYINGSTAASADGFVFTACRILNNKQHGVNINKGQNINFSNCVIAGNDSSATNTYSGVEIASDISSVSIFGCRICQSGTASNTQKYAIEIGGGASNELRFLNNDLSPNVTPSITTPYTYINVLNEVTGTGNEIGSPIILNSWRPDSGPTGLAVSSAGSLSLSVLYFQPVIFRQHINAMQMIQPVQFAVSSSATGVTASGGHTISIAVYTRGTGANYTRIETHLTRSARLTYSMSSNTQITMEHPALAWVNSSSGSTITYSAQNATLTQYMVSSVGGGRFLVFPISSTFTPGEYWFGFQRLQATAGVSSLGFNSMSLMVQSGSGFPGGWAHWGAASSATGAGIQMPSGFGTAATTNAWPASFALSTGIRALSGVNSVPYFELYGGSTTTNDI